MRTHWMTPLIAMAAFCSALTVFSPSLAMAAAFLLAVAHLTFVLVRHGLIASTDPKIEHEFYSADSQLSASDTHDSLGATWLMLGNVLVANMFLAQSFGILTVWLLLTWIVAFYVISKSVPVIKEKLMDGETLHGFLDRAYSSRKIRLAAALVTTAAGIGVYAVELVAIVAVVSALYPKTQTPVVGQFIVLAIVIGMAAATMLGGLRGIVTSDAYIWKLSILGVIAMAMVALVVGIVAHGTELPSQLAIWPTQLPEFASSAFFAGVFALQVPLLLGDYGTWQRIRATKLADTPEFGRIVARLGIPQAALWSVPLVIGLIVLSVPAIDNGSTGNLYASAAPLIELFHHFSPTVYAGIPAWFQVFLCSLMLVGLFAVIISTADSYLLIAVESWVKDFRPSTGGAIDDARRGRYLVVVFSLLGLLPALVLVATGFNMLTMVLIVFGAQVALAPVALHALTKSNIAASDSSLIANSLLMAFVLAVGFGCLSVLWPWEGDLAGWMPNYGPFLVPVLALVVPTCAILLCLVRGGEANKIGPFLKSLLWPR